MSGARGGLATFPAAEAHIHGLLEELINRDGEEIDVCRQAFGMCDVADCPARSASPSLLTMATMKAQERQAVGPMIRRAFEAGSVGVVDAGLRLNSQMNGQPREAGACPRRSPENLIRSGHQFRPGRTVQPTAKPPFFYTVSPVPL